MEEEGKKKLDAENISVLFKVLRRRVANKIRQPLVDDRRYSFKNSTNWQRANMVNTQTEAIGLKNRV